MMPAFELRPMERYHCGRMSRALRSQHAESIIALGVNSHRELSTCFDQSGYKRAWFIDGELAAIGGCTGMMLSSSGYIWLALSERATKFPVAVVRAARRQIAEMRLTKRDLITTIVPSDKAALRFAQYLGFVVAHSVPVPLGTGHAIVMRHEDRTGNHGH